MDVMEGRVRRTKVITKWSQNYFRVLSTLFIYNTWFLSIFLELFINSINGRLDLPRNLIRNESRRFQEKPGKSRRVCEEGDESD